MADLSKWVDPVSLGPFRMGLRHPQAMDLKARTDAELLARLRELFPIVVKSWRISATQEDARLVIFGITTCPDLMEFLSDQEALDLGL